jgi:AcrR family transcriptional regulator
MTATSAATATTTTTTTEARAEAAQALVSAGRTLFARHGYRQTEFTDLAAAAGLDVTYARELLPDKAAVFGALIERTVKVAGLLRPAVAEGVDEDLPARLARIYLALWEPGEEEESPLVELYRIALSDREASEVLRGRISEALNAMVDHELPGADAELRTALFGAQLGGTAIARHLLGVRAITAADIETVIETLTPGLRRTLLDTAPSE